MQNLYQPSYIQTLVLIGYSLIWLILVPFALIRFIYQVLRRKPGYSLARLSRYGLLINHQAKPNGYLIHCASVGEVVAIQSLVDKLLSKNPNQAITITTNTTTGAQRVQSLFEGKVSHAYLPYDFPLFIWLFLKNVQPSKVLINEMELWPNFCHGCWKLSIPVCIINGRMSEKSASTYRKLSALFVPMFAKITMICAQGARDYTNYISLGVNTDKLVLTNNIKFDLTISPKDISNSQIIKKAHGLNKRRILVAGSTHEPEEQILVDAYLSLLKTFPDLLLVIVPRHPQRFDKVHQLLARQGIEVNLMSKEETCSSNTQVLLCDQMGKLRSIYALADIAFVGGSLSERGGHNALEPAAVAVPIIMGPSNYNNPAICQALVDAGALQEVNNQQQIIIATQKWLTQPIRKKNDGLAGQKVLEENSGAMQKTLDALGL